MDPGFLGGCGAVEYDVQDAEAAGVPGVGAFDFPSAGVVDLDVGALRGDLPVAPQFGQQVPGDTGVVAGIQIDPDGLGQVEPESGLPLQTRAQQWRVVPVGPGQHDADGQAVALAQDGALLAGLGPVGGVGSGVVPAAGGLHAAPVDREVLQIQADQPVEGLKDSLFQVGEYTVMDPLIAPLAQCGGRDLLVGVLGVRTAEHQPGDELVEDDPIPDPGSVTAQRMVIVNGREKCLELAEEGLDD